MEQKSTRGKTALRVILNTLLIIGGLVVGFFLLLMLIFAHPREQFAILTLYPATMALLFLLVNGHWRKKWFLLVLAAWLALAVGCGVSLGVYYAEQALTTVDDRRLILSNYHPFLEGTQAVTLPEESTLQLSYEEASTLRIDGATALYPVYASFVRNAFEPAKDYHHPNFGGSYMGGDTLACTGTTDAYQRLIDGDVDVIFCAGPSQKQLEAAEAAGLQLHLTPIGREAFVFFVNVNNPVTGLTVEQIQRIYTGEITNWQDVGGRNQKIRAYQRAEGSGSQTALQSLMAGLPLMEAETEQVVADMGGIIERVATYRNFDGALGFTFRFYSNEMVGNNQIRLLALNGVEPTKDTIRDGSYPISSYFYAVTASPIGQPAPEESNPTLKAFLDWCQGPQGQWIVEEVGYVAVDSTPAEDAAAESTAQSAPPANIRWIQKEGNFVFTSDEDGAIITGYLGSDEAVVIPDALGGHPVVSIANYAFSSQKYSGTSQLRTITIPDTVTYIGVGAFQGRSKLERIIFSPDSQLRQIDNSAFFDCPSLTDVQLPGQVERIGHEAFGYCASLTSFHIPASVSKMEVNPFPYCKALTSITVDPDNEYFTVIDNMLIDKQPREIDRDDPNTVKTGSICLLSYPCGLTETQISVPEGVTEISHKAFFWCESLQNVTLPESLQAIGMSAFYGCTSLEHVNLPAGLTHITTDPFGQRPESFTVTVTPYSCGEDWAIRYDVPYTH